MNKEVKRQQRTTNLTSSEGYGREGNTAETEIEGEREDREEGSEAGETCWPKAWCPKLTKRKITPMEFAVIRTQLSLTIDDYGAP